MRLTQDRSLREILGRVSKPNRNVPLGRAMHELDVRLILAHSPQAKERVERRHQVFQDRLVKALRFEGPSVSG